MAAAARIDALIKQFPVFVVSKSYCPFCHMAKDVLNKYKIPQDKMKIVEIENDPDCGEIQDHMLKITGGRTVRFILDKMIYFVIKMFLGSPCVHSRRMHWWRQRSLCC